jgi:hypothetical protein
MARTATKIDPALGITQGVNPLSRAWEIPEGLLRIRCRVAGQKAADEGNQDRLK